MPFYGLILLLAMGMQTPAPKLIKPTITQEPMMQIRHKCPEGYRLARLNECLHGCSASAIYIEPENITVDGQTYEYVNDPTDPPTDDGYRCVAAEKGKP